MARRVKVSTIGAKSSSVRFEEGKEKALDDMLGFWREEFSNVLCDRPDLIVVPECCDWDSSFNAEQRTCFTEYRGERVFSYFADAARKNRCYIAYSSIWPGGDGKNRNSTVMLDREGEILGVYDKYHGVPAEMEEIGGACGQDAVIFDCDFGRVGALICFDLNFDEIRNLYKEKKPELLLFSSMYHGSFMQNFWAYEMRSYFVSAVANLESAIINPVGAKIAATTNYTRHLTKSINLDYEVVHLDGNMHKLKAAKEKYGSKIDIFDPGYLGAVLLTSETEEFTASQIAETFSMERLDDYFARCLAWQGETRAKRRIWNPYRCET